MADLQPDTSMYPTQANQQPNALQTVGQYQGVLNSMSQNQLLQQEIPIAAQRAQQAQIETQIAQGKQRAGQLLAENTDANGNPNWLGFQSAAAKDPLTAHPEVFSGILALVNDQLSQTPGGYTKVNGGYTPVNVSKQKANQMYAGQGSTTPSTANAAPSIGPSSSTSSDNNSEQNQSQSTSMTPPDNNGLPAGTVMSGVPLGSNEAQSDMHKHWQTVQDSANAVPQENAALNNMLNISKKGADSGTIIGEAYQALASTGLVPAGVTDKGAQLSILKGHAAQVNLSGGNPGSDARLDAFENAGVDDKDLPQKIQAMVPYLLAVNKGKVAQANYYRQNAPLGTDPSQVSKVQGTWTNNFDPRLLEMKELQSDPTALSKYISGLSTQDRQQLLAKYRSSKQLGLLGQ